MKFYDTCSLLKKVENLFDEETFVISSVTIQELEKIKVSNNKDPDIKFIARKLLHLLEENEDKYIIHIFTSDMLELLDNYNLSASDDIKILATALDFRSSAKIDLIFVTDDLVLKNIAKLFFKKDCVQSIGNSYDDKYKGYKEIYMTDDELTEFYSSPTLILMD